LSTFLHGPDDTIIYDFDYSDWLNQDETITDSTWTPDPGITVESDSSTETTTAAKVSVSVTSGIHRAVNRITTSLGEQISRTLTLIIEEQ
jgi:hypothetical protein